MAPTRHIAQEVPVGIPIFLSRAEPYTTGQEEFLKCLCRYLAERGLEARTVGDTDYGLGGLEAVRALMMQSNGLISVAFRRIRIDRAFDRPNGDRDFGRVQQIDIDAGTWLTTPWCHMETAMAYQIGLPIMILVEKDVRLDGTLEGGVLVQYPPEFNVHDGAARLDDYFDNAVKWRQLVASWEGNVREVLRCRSRPPLLFGAGGQ
jgi:hypothetical protein